MFLHMENVFFDYNINFGQLGELHSSRREEFWTIVQVAIVITVQLRSDILRIMKILKRPIMYQLFSYSAQFGRASIQEMAQPNQEIRCLIFLTFDSFLLNQFINSRNRTYAFDTFQLTFKMY